VSALQEQLRIKEQAAKANDQVAKKNLEALHAVKGQNLQAANIMKEVQVAQEKVRRTEEILHGLVPRLLSQSPSVTKPAIAEAAKEGDVLNILQPNLLLHRPSAAHPATVSELSSKVAK